MSLWVDIHCKYVKNDSEFGIVDGQFCQINILK